jgi:phenylpropionate dioxygenase-like ring-hydroxylating dioxygenase large terminal subunit
VQPWSPPTPVDTWHLVAGADALRPGRVLPVEVGGERSLVAVGPAGPFTLRARCPHQGADLSGGRLDGERLRCPLHGLGFSPDGRCDRAGVPAAAPGTVDVGAGAVFVHPAPARGRVPLPERFGPLAWSAARPERVPVPWTTILVNAFDLHHLRPVHRREVVSPPVLDQPAPDQLRMRYATRPIGRGLSDRVTRALSPAPLDIHLTLVGALLMWVEVDLGRARTTAVVGLTPRGEETVLWLAVGVPRTLGWSLRARLARWLYRTFLRRDLPILRDVRLSPRSDLPEDATVQRLVDFLEARPGR